MWVRFPHVRLANGKIREPEKYKYYRQDDSVCFTPTRGAFPFIQLSNTRNFEVLKILSSCLFKCINTC